MKTSELTGTQLDRWVAKARGLAYANDSVEHGTVWHFNPDTAPFGEFMNVKDYTPSTNGAQCFELLTIAELNPEREVWWNTEGNEISWTGGYEVHYLHYAMAGITSGPTLNIAICRAFVASVYGEEVSDE